jgi:hypothetical protein
MWYIALDDAVPAINADLAPRNKSRGITGEEDDRTLELIISEIVPGREIVGYVQLNLQVHPSTSMGSVYGDQRGEVKHTLPIGVRLSHVFCKRYKCRA